MQKITPFLWFNNQAEEAVNFYTSIFKSSKIKSVTRYGEAGAQVSVSGPASLITYWAPTFPFRYYLPSLHAAGWSIGR